MTTLHLHQAERVTEREQERERQKETMPRINWQGVWQTRGANGEREETWGELKRDSSDPELLKEYHTASCWTKVAGLRRLDRLHSALLRITVELFYFKHCNDVSPAFSLSQSLLSSPFLHVLLFPFPFVPCCLSFFYLFTLPFVPSRRNIPASISPLSLFLSLSFVPLGLNSLMNVGVGGVGATSAIIPPAPAPVLSALSGSFLFPGTVKHKKMFKKRSTLYHNAL